MAIEHGTTKEACITGMETLGGKEYPQSPKVEPLFPPIFSYLLAFYNTLELFEAQDVLIYPLYLLTT